MEVSSSSAKGRYAQLEPLREPYLKRARDASKLTIPSLMPQSGHNASSNLPTPFQGMGARGVNNLASKLLLALFPPNSSFFRLNVPELAIQAISGGDEKAKTEIEKTLGAIERDVQTEVESSALRVSAFEALKQLICCGNVLVYLPQEGGMKVYRMDRYVIRRDPMGEPLELLIKESVSPQVLPSEVREAIKKSPEQKGDPRQTVDLYTWIIRNNDTLHVHQEVEDIIIPGTSGTLPIDVSPWLPLRWAKIDSEDYGRGHVEEYLGDLRSLEGLMQAIVEGSAAAAKMIFLVNPNGTTKASTISEAPNCAVRAGKADDVTVLQANKFADFKTAQEVITMIQQRLAQAFLLMESVTRQAERVTAEEIRRMAGELEDALGGVYSILTQEFQLPLVRRLMFQMENDGKLPELPKDLVKPSIVTGVEALGRGHDLNRLIMFFNILQQTFGPGGMNAINTSVATTQLANALSLDIEGLVKTEDQMAQEQQMAQRQQLMQQIAPEAIRAAKEQGQQQQEQQVQ